MRICYWKTLIFESKLWERLVYWPNELKYFIYRIARWIRRSIKWAVFFWRNNIEEWDQSFIFQVFAFELEIVRKHHEANKRHLDWPNVTKAMQICELSLKRMAFRDYYFEFMQEHFYSKYGEHKLIWRPSECGRFSSLVGSSFNGIPETPAQKKEHALTSKLGQQYERSMKAQDSALFSKIFSKKSDRWWD